MTTQTQETTTFTIDTSHSMAEFTVRHLMISKVRGRFAAFQGTLEVPAGKDLPSAVAVTIDASSIDTREEKRDAHLRSADFFNVEKFPELTFKGTRIVERGGSDFQIVGDLTMHGVTREVVLDTEFEGRGDDPWGNQRVAYSAHVTINRKDFDLNWNAALEAGGVMVSDEVKIELNIAASAPK